LWDLAAWIALRSHVLVLLSVKWAMSDDLRPLTPLTGGSARDFLDRRGIEHQGLSERDALHLAYVLAGFVLTVPANSGPITATVWIASALTAGGRYVAPELPEHVADLGDGGSMVDSIVLMAVVQRHLLHEPRPGWGDGQLARGHFASWKMIPSAVR
jgi:hypothetical protein